MRVRSRTLRLRRAPRPRTWAAAALALAVGLLALRAAVWVAQEQEARVAATHLAAVVVATPDGGTVDLATAFSAPWDRAAVVGDYAFGSDVNELLGRHVLDDDKPLTAEDSDLVFVDGDRVVAVIPLARQPYGFGDARDPSWRPFAITRDHARFTVLRSGATSNGAVLVPTEDDATPDLTVDTAPQHRHVERRGGDEANLMHSATSRAAAACYGRVAELGRRSRR